MSDKNNGTEAVGPKAWWKRVGLRLAATQSIPVGAPVTPIAAEPTGVWKRCKRCDEPYPPTSSSNCCRECGWLGELVPIDDEPRRAA